MYSIIPSNWQIRPATPLQRKTGRRECLMVYQVQDPEKAQVALLLRVAQRVVPDRRGQQGSRDSLVLAKHSMKLVYIVLNLRRTVSKENWAMHELCEIC